ncbi:MAG: Tm-1-like ATP-binding domain-containing protein [Enterocloster asparagiformis]|nr:Tm-1-like ATP-binding domain-containing protein [Enterocloster asparagiformis]
MDMAKVAVIATLDTKGTEAGFLRSCLEELGHEALIMDTGLLGEPLILPDISRQELMGLAGADDLDALRREGKAALMAAMTRGLREALVKLQREGKIQGALSLGGGQGTAISAAAMQALPVGFPKVIVSTIACGTARFGDYVGSRDIVMIPSIADICGLNGITVPILASACGAVSGMIAARRQAVRSASGPRVALTMAGVTTRCVMRVKELLDNKGYETIVCHCNVVGAQVIDEYAGEGRLDGVLDITPHDVGGMLFGGLMSCGPDRFARIYASGIPVVTVPGAVDFILKGPEPEVDPELLKRPHYRHTPFHTHIRATWEEMYRAGAYLAERHNGCKGRNAILVPENGYSQQNAPGGLIYDPQANRGFVQGVLEHKADSVEFGLRKLHINDPAFAEEIVAVFEKLLEPQAERSGKHE